MVRFILLLACALGLATPAVAQSYPDRTVKIIVPQPPGGGFDTVARILADRLGPLLGQGMIVENRVGAGTLVGTEAAAKAPADGYTLLLGGLSNIALNPGLYAKLPYQFLTMTFIRHALWLQLSVTGDAEMGHLCSLSNGPTGSG